VSVQSTISFHSSKSHFPSTFVKTSGIRQNFEGLLQQMRHMKIEVLIDDGNKIKKESFFILDPDKIKIEIYTNSSQA
jgi:hypothetical protein